MLFNVTSRLWLWGGCGELKSHCVANFKNSVLLKDSVLLVNTFGGVPSWEKMSARWIVTARIIIGL